MIKRFDVFVKEANAGYTNEWPMNKQEIGVTTDDVSNNQDYIKSEGKFQEIQEHMKLILKPMLMKKNPNANDNDIDKVSNSFFNLGAEKAAQVKKLVDNSKDAKQTAQEIVNRYYKYVKINFGTKDNVNNVEQDSVMTSEGIDFLGIEIRRKINKLKDEKYSGAALPPFKDGCGDSYLTVSELEKIRAAGLERKLRHYFKVTPRSNIDNKGDFWLLSNSWNDGEIPRVGMEDIPESVNSASGICPECNGKGYTNKGKCKICRGTGLVPVRKKAKTRKILEQRQTLKYVNDPDVKIKQEKWLDLFFRNLIISLEKGYEDKVITNFKKLDDIEGLIKNEYFANKVDLLIAKSREYNCRNVEDFLVNYKENL